MFVKPNHFKPQQFVLMQPPDCTQLMKSVWHFWQLPAFEVTDACCFLFHMPIGLELTFLEARGRFCPAFSQPGPERPWGWCHLMAPGLCTHVDICQDVIAFCWNSSGWKHASVLITALFTDCRLGQGKCTAAESPRSELFSVALEFHFVVTVSTAAAVFVQFASD